MSLAAQYFSSPCRVHKRAQRRDRRRSHATLPLVFVLLGGCQFGGESQLAEAYKKINAPRGELGRRTLMGTSTRGLSSTDPNVYNTLESRLSDITQQRNGIAGQMIAMLEAAAFDNKAIEEQLAKNLIDQANDLMKSLDE